MQKSFNGTAKSGIGLRTSRTHFCTAGAGTGAPAKVQLCAGLPGCCRNEGQVGFPSRRQGSMKRTVQNAAAESPDAALVATLKKEGSNGSSPVSEDLNLILSSLQTMR